WSEVEGVMMNSSYSSRQSLKFMISIPHIWIYVFESIDIISAIGRLEIRVRPAIFGTVNSSKVTFLP
ncbi:hypothetical protein, partial [Escherichia coli]|uniref:hypothetical protein n=1 Tax=Escherichia coli TaxID=562 RepID=UPI001BDD1038